MNEENKVIIDVVAGTGTAAAYMAMVPDVVALFTGVWILIRIYETETVRRIIKRIQGCGEK
jgi:HAMP domain-containing protein